MAKYAMRLARYKTGAPKEIRLTEVGSPGKTLSWAISDHCSIEAMANVAQAWVKENGHEIVDNRLKPKTDPILPYLEFGHRGKEDVHVVITNARLGNNPHKRQVYRSLAERGVEGLTNEVEKFYSSMTGHAFNRECFVKRLTAFIEARNN